jgi:hypothetical protein
VVEQDAPDLLKLTQESFNQLKRILSS